MLIHEIVSKRLIELNILGRILRAVVLHCCRSVVDVKEWGDGQNEFSQQSLLRETCYHKGNALALALECPLPLAAGVLRLICARLTSDVGGALVLVGVSVPQVSAPQLLLCSDAIFAVPPRVGDDGKGSLLCALQHSVISAWPGCAAFAARSRSDEGRVRPVTARRVIGRLLDRAGGRVPVRATLDLNRLCLSDG